MAGTDLAVANYESNNVSVLRGLSDGRFVVDAYLPAGVGPMDVEVADLDRDGDLDLLVASIGERGGDQVAVFGRNTLRQRGFGFEPPASHGATNFPLLERFGT